MMTINDSTLVKLYKMLSAMESMKNYLDTSIKGVKKFVHINNIYINIRSV